MVALSDVLADPALNGAYRISDTVSDLPGFMRLDARALGDRGSLLAALGAVLDFPDYYGVNWDALEECLSDLSWREGPVRLLVEHAGALAADDLATLAQIWGEAAASWGEAGRGFVLLLHGAGPKGLPVADR